MRKAPIIRKITIPKPRPRPKRKKTMRCRKCGKPIEEGVLCEKCSLEEENLLG